MNINTRYISSSAVYILATAVLLTLFFEFWRFVLMLFSHELASGVPAGVLLKSFVVGARFDFRTTSIMLVPLALVAVLPGVDIARHPIVRRVHYLVTVVMASIVFFFHLVDIEFFRFFHTRLNGSALLWEDSPGDVVSLVWSTYPVIRMIIMWIVVTAAFALILKWLLNRIVVRNTPSPWPTNLLFLPLLAVVLTMGTLGRIWETAPMRWGLAYFSEYDFANQLTLNPTYQFVRDVFYDSTHREKIDRLVAEIEDPQARFIAADLIGVDSTVAADTTRRMVRPVRFDPPNPDPPNVILVLMESFGSTKIDCMRSKYPYELTPRFDALADRGILFTNVYSGGTHTYAGLLTTLYGVPHLFGKVIMKQVGGHGFFEGLPSILRRHGYHTIFGTTQDPHFDNMQGFVRAHGVMDVIGLYDYDRSDEYSWLGVPDHVMFDTAFVRLKQYAEDDRKFFATLLTASHHGPWFIPDVLFEHIPESENRHMELNSLKYSDWALGRFVEMVQQDSAFDNTLIVVTSDNGYIWEPYTDLDPSILQIPLLLLEPGSKPGDGIRIDRVGTQYDIVPTVMGRLRLDYDNYTLGNDKLDSTAEGSDFAMSTRWYEIGFVQDHYYLVTRQNGGVETLYDLDNPGRNLLDSLPEIAADMRHKVLALYQTAYREMYMPLWLAADSTR